MGQQTSYENPQTGSGEVSARISVNEASVKRRTPLHFGRVFMVAGGGFEPPTFGLCDLTHLSMRVGLYLHPRGMLAIQSLRLTPPFRGLGSMVSFARAGRFHDFGT